MNKKEKRARLGEIIERLKEIYPESECALNWDGDPWRLMVMGRLSAQCTDQRVNIVSKELFRRYPTPKDASMMLVSEYGGRVPDDMDELLRFAGVGRKIANLILGDAFGKEAIVCDTHCIRICGRLGMYSEELRDPYKIEMILRDLMDASEGSDFCHRIVNFGREICTARAPKCEACPLADICEHKKKRGY